MPKYFPNHEWDEQLAKFRYRGVNKNGTQCKRNVIIGLPLCFQHTASVYHLKKKDLLNLMLVWVYLHSMIKQKLMMRLYLNQMMIYVITLGQVVTKEILDERYGNYTSPYGIEVSANQNKYEDTETQRGIGSLLNHQPKSDTNCKFVKNYRFIKIRAHKNIQNGAELFINYGRDYRFNDQVQYSTNTKSRVL
jgi:hypothetical protein